MCSKVRYLTRSFAKKQMRSAYGPQCGMNVYRCECGFFHFGHATAAYRKKMRLKRLQLER